MVPRERGREHDVMVMGWHHGLQGGREGEREGGRER